MKLSATPINYRRTQQSNELHVHQHNVNRRIWVRKLYRRLVANQEYPGQARFLLWNVLFDITLGDNVTEFVALRPPSSPKEPATDDA